MDSMAHIFWSKNQCYHNPKIDCIIVLIYKNLSVGGFWAVCGVLEPSWRPHERTPAIGKMSFLLHNLQLYSFFETWNIKKISYR